MMLTVDAGEDRFITEPTLLKALLRMRHWQKRDTFSRQWDNVAKEIEPRLVGGCPAHAQFYRWLNGKIHTIPNPDACRVLEAMFPGLTVRQLFQPVRATRARLLTPESSAVHEGRDMRDTVTAYPMRGLIPRPKWNDTIRGCEETLWLYGMAELGYALDDEVPTILREAAGFCCDIRILLLDPEYNRIIDIDADEGSPPGTLSARIRAALARFQEISRCCDGKVQIRVYDAPPNVSLVRGDNKMLVTPYLRFFVGSNSPSLELQYPDSGEMFERYTRHFRRTWDLAKDCVK